MLKTSEVYLVNVEWKKIFSKAFWRELMRHFTGEGMELLI